MTLRKIEVFLLVATKLNMTKVSKEYFVSQPAISQMIKEIENEFEVKLFNRIGKKLHLTNEGKILKEYSKKMLNLHSNLKDDLSDF
jgi:DNA-binding transcriptional LysR family regulator